MAKLAPQLENAGLGLLGSLLVLADWDIGDLLPLFDEILPGLSTTVSFSIIACMKKDAEVLRDLAS